MSPQENFGREIFLNLIAHKIHAKTFSWANTSKLQFIHNLPSQGLRFSVKMKSKRSGQFPRCHIVWYYFAFSTVSLCLLWALTVKSDHGDYPAFHSPDFATFSRKWFAHVNYLLASPRPFILNQAFGLLFPVVCTFTRAAEVCSVTENSTSAALREVRPLHSIRLKAIRNSWLKTV